MDVLLESPLAVGAIGLLVVTMAAIVFSQSRSRVALVVLAAAVLAAVGALVGERAYQTPREQVRSAIGRLFDAIRADDLPGVLATIDPGAAEMRADAELLMPMFRIESASEGGEVRVDLPDDPRAEGAEATARLKPLIKAHHTQSGVTGAYYDTLEIDLVLRDGRWLLKSYRPAKDWRDSAAQLGH